LLDTFGKDPSICAAATGIALSRYSFPGSSLPQSLGVLVTAHRLEKLAEKAAAPKPQRNEASASLELRAPQGAREAGEPAAQLPAAPEIVELLGDANRLGAKDGVPLDDLFVLWQASLHEMLASGMSGAHLASAIAHGRALVKAKNPGFWANAVVDSMLLGAADRATREGAESALSELFDREIEALRTRGAFGLGDNYECSSIAASLGRAPALLDKMMDLMELAAPAEGSSENSVQRGSREHSLGLSVRYLQLGFPKALDEAFSAGYVANDPLPFRALSNRHLALLDRTRGWGWAGGEHLASLLPVLAKDEGWDKLVDERLAHICDAKLRREAARAIALARLERGDRKQALEMLSRSPLEDSASLGARLSVAARAIELIAAGSLADPAAPWLDLILSSFDTLDRTDGRLAEVLHATASTLSRVASEIQLDENGIERALGFVDRALATQWEDLIAFGPLAAAVGLLGASKDGGAKARRVAAVALANILEREASFASNTAGTKGLLSQRRDLRRETWALLDVASRSSSLAGLVPNLRTLAIAPPGRFFGTDPSQRAPDLSAADGLAKLGPYGEAGLMANTLLETIDAGLASEADRRYDLHQVIPAVVQMAASPVGARARVTLRELVKRAGPAERRLLIVAAARAAAELGLFSLEGALKGDSGAPFVQPAIAPD
jgi:hypothetical protein